MPSAEGTSLLAPAGESGAHRSVQAQPLQPEEGARPREIRAQCFVTAERFRRRYRSAASNSGGSSARAANCQSRPAQR